MKKVPIQTSVHPRTAEAIKTAAQRQQVSISELVRRLLEHAFPPVQLLDEQKKSDFLRRAA